MTGEIRKLRAKVQKLNNDDISGWLIGKDVSLFKALITLRNIRRKSPETSVQDATDIINKMNIGLYSRWLDYHEMTWEHITNHLQKPNTSLLIVLPNHLTSIYGFVQTLDFRYRHLVTGRPSGGQCPSGFIPWSHSDLTDNVSWPNDAFSSLSSYKARDVTNEEPTFGEYCKIAVIQQLSSVDLSIKFNQSFVPPSELEWWLQEEEVFCKYCCNDFTKKDAIHKEKIRKMKYTK